MSCDSNLYTLPLRDGNTLCLTNNEVKKLREKYRNNQELTHFGLIRIDREDFEKFLNKVPITDVMSRIYKFASPKTKSSIKQVDKRLNHMGTKIEEIDTKKFMNSIKEFEVDEDCVPIQGIPNDTIRSRYFDDKFYETLRELDHEVVTYIFTTMIHDVPNLLEGDSLEFIAESLFYITNYSTFVCGSSVTGEYLYSELLKRNLLENFIINYPVEYIESINYINPNAFEDETLETIKDIQNSNLDWNNVRESYRTIEYYPILENKRRWMENV